jgi:hypothetical protein
MQNISRIAPVFGRVHTARTVSQQRSRRKRQYLPEALESRTLLSTLSFPSAGSLDYVGTAATASDLTVSTD